MAILPLKNALSQRLAILGTIRLVLGLVCGARYTRRPPLFPPDRMFALLLGLC